MKKIAILAPYVGIINRGAETFVIELVSTLKDKYIIDVYSTAISEKIESNIIKVRTNKGTLLKIHSYLFDKISFYRKVINRFYFLIPDVIFQKKFSKRVFKYIRNEKYDLIFPNNGYWGAHFANDYRKKKNTPFIYTGHGGIGFGEKKILECNPNAYICLTNKHYNWCLENCNKNTKVYVIPNGVHVNAFGSSKRIENKEYKLILSVGALTSFKRHELTIKAVSKLPKAKLVILGSGEEYKNLKKLADALLGERYEILAVPYNKVKEYYHQADLFVLPSLEEPFGIVYLEAMASNLPIVAPDDAPRREIIANAGIYCDVENADEYARCIKKALNTDFKTIPLSRAKYFDWSLVCDKYKTVFEEMLNPKS